MMDNFNRERLFYEEQEQPQPNEAPHIPMGEPNEDSSSFYSSSPCPPNKPPENRGGMKIFFILLSLILVFLLLVVVSFWGTRKSKVEEELQISTDSQNSSVSLPTVSISENSSEISSEEQIESAHEPSDELSTEEIAAKVQPSVVGLEVVFVSSDGVVNNTGGSGIIMSSDGYIITNAHVVLEENTQEMAEKISVHLDNGEIYEAVLIGADTKTDLAVVKINAENLVPAEFGDSSAVQIGEKAVAIGNPGGLTLASSVTQGVISGVNRMISNGNSESNSYLQTDAAINPGNSGGALVNKYGQVVGINTIKIVAEDYEGIGFAIPINDAKPVIDSIIQKGYVSGRVRIGISYTEVTASMAEMLQVPQGLRVVQVESESDAAVKGIRKGDIITKLDGTGALDTQTVKDILNQKHPGDIVRVTVYRVENGQEKTMDFDIELYEDLSGAVRPDAE